MGDSGGMHDVGRNKDAVSRFYNDVFINHDMSRLDGYMRDDYIQHNPDCRQGKAGFVEFFDVIFRAVPDFAYTLKKMVAEGDIVMAYSTTTGTHTGGPLAGPRRHRQQAGLRRDRCLPRAGRHDRRALGRRRHLRSVLSARHRREAVGRTRGRRGEAMTVSPFDRFAVRSPIAGPGMSAAEGPREARRTFLSGGQVPEADHYVEMGWIKEVPDGGPATTGAGGRLRPAFAAHRDGPGDAPGARGHRRVLPGWPADRLQHHHLHLHPQGHASRADHLEGVSSASRAARHRVRHGRSLRGPGRRRCRRVRRRCSQEDAGIRLRLRAFRDPQPHERSRAQLRRQSPEPHHDLSEPHPDRRGGLLPGVRVDMGRSRPAHPQDAARRLRRDRVPHRQRPG